MSGSMLPCLSLSQACIGHPPTFPDPCPCSFPPALPQAYIDFEIGEGERQRTRLLYQRLLDRTKHVKVWLSFAHFEAAALPGALEEPG